MKFTVELPAFDNPEDLGYDDYKEMEDDLKKQVDSLFGIWTAKVKHAE